ncbi:MAG: hypothetical protein NTW49_08855 [Bacteroidia bacterium]|nr:hypothetical protein [Bacteroidia bacterium]
MKTKNSMIPSSRNELPTNPIFDAYNNLIIDLTSDFNSHHDVKVLFDDGLFTYQLTLGQKNFFENLYVVGKDDSFVFIPENVKMIYPELSDLRIGKNEWQLIDFVTSENFEMTRLVSIITPIGRGKTTLLSYTFLYLREMVPNLKKRVIPIAINCHGIKAPLNDRVYKNETFDFLLTSVFKPALLKIIDQFIKITDNAFWDWYCENYQTTYGHKLHSYNDALNEVTTDQEKDFYRSQIFQLKNEEQDKEEYLYSAIEYVKKTYKKEIVFIFDNMDFLSINSIQFLIEFVERIKGKTSLKFILTLREITSRKVSEAFRGTLFETMLDWVPVNSIEVMNRRCNLLNESLVSEAERNPIVIRNIKIFVSNVKELILGLTSAISNSTDLIELFANNNMRNELQLFRIILKSGLLPEWSLNTVLFQFSDEIQEIKKIPTYIVLESIVTNNYGTYIDSKKRAVPGLINILSTNKTPEILDFLYLLVLSDLMKHDNNDILVKNINNRLFHLLNCCDREIFDESFYDIITSLLNAGLLVSSEVYEISASDNVRTDVKYINISDLGRFYMNNLIYNYNYIVFVKDNINLKEINFEGTIETRIISYSENRFNRQKYTRLNLINLTRFFDEFVKKELEFLTHIKSQEKLLQYFDFYSSVNKSLYTVKMIDSIIRFFDNERFGNSDVLDELKSQKKTINIEFYKLLQN